MIRADLAALVESHLRSVPDFPKPGVVFKDFTPLLRNPLTMAAVVDNVVSRYQGRVDLIAGIEARGFILGASVAHAMGVGFVPVRKAGKLPGDTFTVAYSLEYGETEIEIHTDAVRPGERVLVMDDVLATGGTAEAACTLVERSGGTVVAIEVVLEIPFLGGRSKLAGREVYSILEV